MRKQAVHVATGVANADRGVLCTSPSSVAGVEVGPQVETGPQDSSEVIALKQALATMLGMEAELQARNAASQARMAASQVSLAASQVRMVATMISTEVFRICKNHDRVKGLLCGMSRASNETLFTVGTLRSKQEELAACAAPLDAARFEPTRAPSPDAVDELMQNCARFKIEQAHYVDGQNPHVLRDFVDFLQKVLKKSEVPSDDYKSEQYSSHIRETVRAIVDWENDTNGSVPALYKPSWKGHETRGAQPIHFAILWKIAFMCNGNRHFFR